MDNAGLILALAGAVSAALFAGIGSGLRRKAWPAGQARARSQRILISSVRS